MTSPEDDAVAVAPPQQPPPPPRRFPSPCWTQEETLVLIDAYRERWYSLRRGYLRTPDWDAVAATVAARCPGASPTKTSAQCRHKMEKLRQRFRAEKQRAAAFPYPGGRYFSSWFFFDNMEAMENGTVAPPPPQRVADLQDGSRLQSFIDHNILKLKLKSGNNSTDSVPELANRFNLPGQYNNSSSFLTKQQPLPVTGIPQPPPLNSTTTKPKKSVTTKFYPNYNEIHHHRPSSDYLQPNQFWVKLPNNTPPTITNLTSAPKLTPNTNPNQLKSGSKRGRNEGGLEQIVGAIKLVGEGFMRMEKAKMEMAREMEGVRMEMEMKRNEMVLESQKQIVDAFFKGLIELKTTKKKNKRNKETTADADDDSAAHHSQ